MSASTTTHLPQARAFSPGDVTTVGLPVLLIAVMVAICMPFTISLGGVVLSPLRMIMLVTCVPLCVLLITGRFGRVTSVDGLVLAYALWQVVSIAVNNPDRVIQFSGSNVLDSVGGYLLGRAAIRNPQEFRGAIKVMLFTLVFLLVPAFIETQTGRLILSDLFSMVGLRGDAHAPAGSRFGLDRAQAVFAHPIHFGIFCSSLFALIFLGLRDHLSLFARLLGGIAVLVGTVLSVSSGALLPVFLQMVMIGWALFTTKMPRRWTIFTLLVLSFYLIAEVASDRPALIAILARITFNSHNVYMRSMVFEWGMINIWANPIMGLGLRDWVRPEWMHSSSTDNFWLLQAMRFGIPAFVFLAGAVGLLMILIGRRKFTPGGVAATCKLAWTIGMVSMVLTLCTVHVWGSVQTFLMMLIGIGHWLVTYTEPDADGADPQQAAQPETRRPAYSRFATAAPAVTRPEQPAQPAQPAQSAPKPRIKPETKPAFRSTLRADSSSPGPLLLGRHARSKRP